MIVTLPEGDGNVSADAAYGGVRNCNTVLGSGRGGGDHRLQVQRGDQGIQRQGGDTDVSARRTRGHSTGYCAFGTTS